MGRKNGPQLGTSGIAPTNKRPKLVRTLGGYFNRLPCEILHDIALMLPFPAIIQLRRSSKFWYDLLTDPNFVDSHLLLARQKPGYLITSGPPAIFQKCYYAEQSGARMVTSKLFECYGDGPRFKSSGGLICVYSRKSDYFRVFNPFISGKHQVIVRNKTSWLDFKWYFSYSPVTNEYKILKFGLVRDTKRKGIRSNVGAICTLGSNVWRKIQNLPFKRPAYDNPLLFAECQGNLFWMEGSRLFSFDFVSEKFSVCYGPPRRGHDNRWESQGLLNMGHTIGCVINFRLWVLEDKMKGIWIKNRNLIASKHNNVGFIDFSKNEGLFVGFTKRSMKFFCGHVNDRQSFRILKMKLDDNYEGVLAKLSRIEYISPCVRSLISPIGIKGVSILRRSTRTRKLTRDNALYDYESDYIN